MDRKWNDDFRFPRFILLFYFRKRTSFCVSIYFYLFTFYLPTLEPFSLHGKVCSLHFVLNCPHKYHQNSRKGTQLICKFSENNVLFSNRYHNATAVQIKMWRPLKVEPICNGAGQFVEITIRTYRCHIIWWSNMYRTLCHPLNDTWSVTDESFEIPWESGRRPQDGCKLSAKSHKNWGKL